MLAKELAYYRTHFSGGRSKKATTLLALQSHPRSRRRIIDGDEGVDFICCRICGDHHRVLNSQHLSKHDTDREAYMVEYHLTPDQLIAKDFRIIQSSRRDYYPNGKGEWLAAMEGIHEKDGKVFAGYLQDNYKHFMNRASGFLAIGIRLCVPPSLTRKKCESAVYGMKRKSSTQSALCTKSICCSTPNT